MYLSISKLQFTICMVCSIVCPIRQQLSKLERDVANLIERQKAISGSLNKVRLLYNSLL